MKLRKKRILTNVILGAGLYLLDSMRDHLSDGVEELRDRARGTYHTASDRVSRATDVIRGEGHPVSTATAALIGLGIGVGIGFLLAPASGEETRKNIAGKAGYYGDKVKDRFSKETESASGTYGV
jgi:hypothetical protein